MRATILLILELVFLGFSVCGCRRNVDRELLPVDREYPRRRISEKEIKRLFWSKIPTVSYCTLVQNPKLYNQKFIRIHALHVRFFGLSELYDPNCPDDLTAKDQRIIRMDDGTTVQIQLGQPKVWVEFDAAAETQSKREI